MGKDMNADVDTDMDTDMGKSGKNPDWKLLIIRLIAGGYLIYLAVSLLREKGGGENSAYLAGPALFFAAGILIGGWALVKLVKREYEK